MNTKLTILYERLWIYVNTLDIQDKLKPIERRLATLKKHIEQADLYMKYKGKKALTDTEQILYTAAHSYLKGVLNGKTTLPTKARKAEYAKLTNQQKTLNQRYVTLKDEVKEAEQIRKSVYSFLRQEQQPRRAQEVDRLKRPTAAVLCLRGARAIRIILKSY